MINLVNKHLILSWFPKAIIKKEQNKKCRMTIKKERREYHLPLLITIYHCISLLTTTYYYSQTLITVIYHQLPFTIIVNYYLTPLITIDYQPLLLITVLHRLSLLIIIYHHLPPLIIIHHYPLALATTYYHWLVKFFKLIIQLSLRAYLIILFYFKYILINQNIILKYF